MSSQGGGGGQRSQIQSLARQGSLYSLTLNDVQSHLGEPLSSMNLDELLKSVFPAEASQSVAMDLDGNAGQYASGSDLQRQGSITMPRSLSKKTVDEVWKDIQQGQNKCNEEPRLGQERQMTLGEMTLEDFLVKAGVVAEGSAKNRTNLVGNVGPVGVADPKARPQDSAQGAHWLHQYHQRPSTDQQQQAQQNMMGAYMPGYPVPQPMGLGTVPILDAMYPEGQMSLSSPTVGTSDPQTPGQKRAASGGMAEKLVERRQKRMIKNRESAARSRARKQAYTHELENKVSRLEEENEKLKKQKKLDEILYVPTPEPRYQLRRTSSAPF